MIQTGRYTVLPRGIMDVCVRAPRTAAAGNGLLNNLIAYWPGNEVNGDALDLHTNALHLTDWNTVTSNTGLVYTLARQYTAANLEAHFRPSDDALLSGGDVDLTIAAWVFLYTLGNHAIATKYYSSKVSDYALWYNVTSVNRFACYFRKADNSGGQSITANTFGLPLTSVWYLVVAWHDSVANTINIQVNDGTVDSAKFAFGICHSAATFKLGTWGTAGGSNHFNGRIGPTMFWKSNAGLGGCLNAAQRTMLYNGGAGLPYTSFTL